MLRAFTPSARPQAGISLLASSAYLGLVLICAYLIFRQAYEADRAPSAVEWWFIASKTPALLLTLWIAGTLVTEARLGELFPTRALRAMVGASLLFWAADAYLTVRVVDHPIPGWLGLQMFLVTHMSLGAVFTWLTYRLARAVPRSRT